MTSTSPAPGPEDQPPHPLNSAPRTWTKARLAARLQRINPARWLPGHTPQPASPGPLPAIPAPGLPEPGPSYPEVPDPELFDPFLSDLDLPEPDDWIPATPNPSRLRPYAQPPVHGPYPFRVVLQISPQMRERHPEWPLSLEEALNAGKPPPDPNPDHRSNSRWTEVQGTPKAPAQARAIIRDTLTQWNLTTLIPDAEQHVTELAASAAQHSPGRPFGLSIHEHRPPGQPRWIRCTVTGTSPHLTPAPPARPGSQTGVRADPDGPAHWFTLTTPGRQAARTAPEHDRELEPGA